MLFLNEPKAFAEVSEGEVLLMPVVQKNIGVEDLDGRNALRPPQTGGGGEQRKPGDEDL